MLAWSPTNLGITVGDHERLVQGLWVSGDFFNVLGVRPALGRLFSSSDDRPGCGASGVVVSYTFWQSQLAGQSSGRRQHAHHRPACGSDCRSDTPWFYWSGDRPLF